MAENKKGFILYSDQIHLFENLEDVEAGRLIKHIFRYVNDQNPDAPDKITNISFEPIKQQLKRDLRKFEAIREKRSQAGKISAEIKKQQTSTKSTSVESVQQTLTKSTDNVNVNVNVNDNVNVNVKDINISFDVFWDMYNKKIGSKEKLKKKWEKLKPTEREKIIETLPIFLSGIKEKQFQPYPDTYLNNRRWEDQISANGKKTYKLYSAQGSQSFDLTDAEYQLKTASGYWTISA
jgi:hypothetical protein